MQLLRIAHIAWCSDASTVDILVEYFSIYWILQEPLCSSKDLECVNRINVDTSSCVKPCTGLMVTSFSKSGQTKDLEDIFPISKHYDKYKIITQNPSGQSGKRDKMYHV